MNSAQNDAGLTAPGCPIRTPPDQSLLSGSPELFAASHVLHRLLAPRHPPYALSSLTTDVVATNALSSKKPVTHMQLSKNSRRGSPLRAGSTTPNAIHRASCNQHASGADRDRTDDLRLARAALSHLSYSPIQPAVSHQHSAFSRCRFQLTADR